MEDEIFNIKQRIEMKEAIRNIGSEYNIQQINRGIKMKYHCEFNGDTKEEIIKLLLRYLAEVDPDWLKKLFTEKEKEYYEESGYTDR
jgi:hypothetical protein